MSKSSDVIVGLFTLPTDYQMGPGMRKRLCMWVLTCRNAHATLSSGLSYYQVQVKPDVLWPSGMEDCWCQVDPHGFMPLAVGYFVYPLDQLGTHFVETFGDVEATDP